MNGSSWNIHFPYHSVLFTLIAVFSYISLDIIEKERFTLVSFILAVFPSPCSSSFSNQDPVVWLPKMKTTFPSHVVAGWHHTNKCITFNDRKAEVLRANFKCPQRKSYVLCCFFLLVACTGINNLDLDYPSWTMRPRVYHRTKYELEVVWIANFMKQSSELL